MTQHRASRSKPVRRVGFSVWLVASALWGLSISPIHAGGNIEAAVNGNTKITDAVWSPLAVPIPWKLNNQGAVNNCDNGNPLCVGGVSPLTLQRAIDGMTAAFNAWQDISTSRITFTYAGTTTQTSIGTDTVHLITFI